MQRKSDGSSFNKSGSFHAGGGGGGGGAGAASAAALFTTPHELVDPITHELLYDPVLTTAGQVCVWGC